MSAWLKLVEGILVLTTTSKTNPLPVAQSDGLSVSGTVTSAASLVLFTTSMLIS